MSNKSKSRLRVEKYPLPDSIDGILSLLREVMDAGSVERVEFALDQPVRVSRVIDDSDPDLEEPNVDLDGVLRHINILEYVSQGASSYQVLVDMMQLVRKEGLNCVCWATGTGEEDLLSKWLEFEERGMPSGSEYLLDRPVYRLGSLPEDTLLLCSSVYPSAEPSEFSLAVKTAIEIRRPTNEQRISRSETDDPVRAGSHEHGATASQLAVASGGLRRVDWKRASNS